MLENSIKSLDDAFLYLSECQFATIEDLFFKKSTSKYEMERQILMGMKFVKYAIQFNICLDNGGRMRDFILSSEKNYKLYLKNKYRNLLTKF